MRKRVLMVGDLHCGHIVGLTPPRWHSTTYHVESWNWWKRAIKKLGPIDVLVHNGDGIDGPGDRSGGTEEITTDREEQAEMLVESLSLIKPKKLLMTYGTGYHVGKSEDWESVAAKRLADRLDIPVKLGAHETLEVNGLIFDIKHKIGSSGIPHGRWTPQAKEVLWNMAWARRGQRPVANVIVRSHVHYFTFCGEPGSKWAVYTLPAVQGMGSKFGSRECSGTVDQGIVWFDVENQNSWDCDWELIPASNYPADVFRG